MNEKALVSIEPVDENLAVAPDWPKIEAAYRAGKPLRAISAQFDIGKNVISRKAKQEGWQKRGTRPGHERMQLYRERQRRGLRCVKVQVSHIEIEGLIKTGYLDPADKDNLEALEAALDGYVSDSFLLV